MKKVISTLLLSSAVIAQLTACSGHQKDKSGAQQITITANKETMNAEQLAEAGEQLMSPYTWNLADRVFSMVLEKDPQNLKAQFYKAFLKPMMTFRGILVRTKPYARAYGDINQLEDTIKKFPESPMKAFLMDGKEDIKSIKDMQDLLVQQREDFSEFRKFLIQHQDMDMTIYLNPYVWQDEIQKQAYSSCLVNGDSSEELSVNCNYSGVAMKKMNSADVVGLRQLVSGWILYYTLYTSYSAEGIDQVMDQLKNPNLTPQQQQNLISSVPTVGKLRKDNTMAEILDLGADFHAAAKWALQYQDRLCAMGPDQINRKGYVFENGFCVTDKDEAQRTIAVLGQALQGAFATSLYNENGIHEATSLNLKSFLSKPAQDLRAIAPVSFNACGQATQLKDKTINGLFPQGDAEKFFLYMNCGNN